MNKSKDGNVGESTAIPHTPKDDFISDRDASMMSTDQSRKEVRRQMETLANPKRERFGLRVMGRGSKIRPGQKHLERTCSWPYSLLGEKEISQVHCIASAGVYYISHI